MNDTISRRIANVCKHLQNHDEARFLLTLYGLHFMEAAIETAQREKTTLQHILDGLDCYSEDFSLAYQQHNLQRIQERLDQPTEQDAALPGKNEGEQ